jgi:outer membrane protein
MNCTVFFLLFGCFSPLALGQEILTLQTCLDKVENNSLQTAAESGSLNVSGINKQFHWWTLFPGVSANTGFNTSFGRRLDPFTNTFATSSVNSQSFGLNASLQLFNGFSYFYRKNSLHTALERDEVGLERKRNELKVRAIETYLDLCKLSVQARLAESRREKYNQIQNIQRLLLKEGRINVIDTLKSHHVLMDEGALLWNLDNESKLKWMDLNFQMGQPLKSLYRVDPSSITAIKEMVQLDEVFQVELVELESESLQNEWKAERAKVLPVVSLNGLLGTGFSTNNKDYLLAGNPTKSYSRQINENLYEGIGIYLNVPLFNRGEWLKTKRVNVVKQEELESRKELIDLQLEKQTLELEQKRLNLKVKLEQCKQINYNLETIYEKSLLLYKEGRLTYPEIETAFMEWQQKIIAYETLQFDLQLLELFDQGFR